MLAVIAISHLNRPRQHWLRRLLLLLLLPLPTLLAPVTSFAQILEFDQNPPGIRWRQIRTPNFQLIFPSAFEQKAQLLSADLEKTIQLLDRHSGRSRPIAILLQNQSVLSNGFVQLAPRRSEFVTTPSQHGMLGDWLDQLAIHELQHVVQFDRLVGQFRAPLLEQLGLAFFGLTLPAWYFEGDAVWVETWRTRFGRGRIPSWSMPYRANLLSGRQFSYQKDYLGSYADVTPGFYEMGYFMVDKLYREYGADIAAKMMDSMSDNLLRPYNFSRTLRRYTGRTTRQWHRETVKDLRDAWQAALDSTMHADYPLYPAKTSGKPENWLLPHVLPNGQILALHQGVGMAPQIIRLDSMGGKTRHKPIRIGAQTAPNYSHAQSTIVWDEIRRNPRYAKQTFSVIVSYDLKKNAYRQLTRGTRFFSPVLHPAGTLIACVEISEQNHSAIVLLDAQSGQVIRRMLVPDKKVTLQTPSFNSDGSRLIMVALSREGTALVELDLETARFTQLVPWQIQQLERPIYHDNDILFKAHYGGIDNIYRLVRKDGRIRPVTQARYGAFNPSIDTARDQLFFNNYTPEGYRISQLSLNLDAPTLPERTLDESQFVPTLLGETIYEHPTRESKSKPYRESSHLFNFHSLSVTAGDFSDPADFRPGIYLLSDNLLNTLQTRLGYAYDSNIRSSEYSASLTYQRYFPIFNLRYANRGATGILSRRTSGSESKDQQDEEPPASGLFWRENHFNFQVQVPLVFFKRHRIYGLSASVGTQFTQRYNLSIDHNPEQWTPTHAEIRQIHDNFVDQIRFPMRYSLAFSHVLRRSALDLGPRWGQSFAISYRHTPFGPVNQVDHADNQHFALRTSLYLPGVIRHHSTIVRFNYQHGRGVYQIVNNIPLVSGFDHLSPEPVTNTLLLNYSFPITYPDWEIGALAYIKRIRGGAFADFQNIFTGPAAANQPRTVGLELRADLNLLRFVLPNFDIGAKLIYVNRDERIRRQMLITYGVGYTY